MKKQSLLLLFFVLILCGCKFSPELQEQPKLKRELIYKDTISQSFFQSSKIYPINGTEAYSEVIDWFNDERIFYLTEQSGKSSIHVYHLFTGEIENIFTSEDTIVEVKVHSNKSTIAISTLDEQSSTSIFIINVTGDVLFSKANIQGDVTFFWNPYDSSQLLYVSYLPNWEFEVHHLSINDGAISEIQIEQTYVQWIDKETIAYIEWNLDEPSYYAPLVFYNLRTKEKEQFHKEVITFFAFPKEKFITLTIESIYDLNTKYTFYNKKQQKNETFVPILDTYSEQWWVPYFDYNEQNSLFVFFRPKFSGPFIDYNETYEVVAYDVKTGNDEVMIELDEHMPVKLSPNGKYLLYGHQFETLIDLEQKNLFMLIEQ